MNTSDQDKAFFEEGLEQLETYILSKELYWPSSVHTTDFSQMSLGAMLLVRERLRGWKISGIQGLVMKMAGVHLKWRAAWDAKAEREIHARLELWKNYLDEAGKAPAEFHRQFPYQVRLRTILALLLEEVHASPPQPLVMLDNVLQRGWQNGTFIWAPEIAWIFPKNTFWYLYGNPSVQEK